VEAAAEAGLIMVGVLGFEHIYQAPLL